jgi:hypothetical protein
MTIKNTQESLALHFARHGPRHDPPPEDVVRFHLAYDLSHGQLLKASIIQRLPLFGVALGDSPEEVQRRLA